MNFKLKVRNLDENDLKTKCPFLPEDEDYSMYLISLVEDIKNLEEVESAELKDTLIIIKLNKSLEENYLNDLIKPFFGGDRFCQYRFVSLEHFNE